MQFHIEVCIDNLESLHNAIAGGATRIELCSSLALGGLTPSFGFMKKAAQISPIPVYAMIRPRQADFLYDQDDVDAMLMDIEAAAEAGLQGVVFGVLTESGAIDKSVAKQLMTRAQSFGLGVTFHRAIDQSVNLEQAIDDIAELGCDRVLTSGLASNVTLGKETLAKMVDLANGRFSIMAGAGLNASNVQMIIEQAGIREVHLSAKGSRPSRMKVQSIDAKMGNESFDDFIIPLTDSNTLQALVSKVLSYN
ncbi:copper homeostasis protein CutC [Vibrio maerlii]|uniref:copper homeostasis protein CutC n=1 Tax=Vibrio maerlii TaxID=2231648 RepID=UPI000E3DA09E|nr:copper homeostasis protein CutC [Vibrio maerlii]